MRVKLKENKRYKLTFLIKDSLITFNPCTIKEDGEDFVVFIDNKQEEQGFSKDLLISYARLKDE